MMKRFFYLSITALLILLAVLSFWAGNFFRDYSVSMEKEIIDIKRNYKIAQTLGTEGPKDVREVDLLTKLTEYCQAANLGAECNVTTARAHELKEYTSKAYKLIVRKAPMKEAMELCEKMEVLPANVRMVRSTIKRITPAGRRGTEVQQPYVELQMEMNELKFRQSS